MASRTSCRFLVRLRGGAFAAVLRLMVALLVVAAMMPVASAGADRPPDVYVGMVTASDLGRTQTMLLESEWPLTLAETADRLEGMNDPAGTLSAWGWEAGYERTFISNDALPNDAHLVQVTLHQFSSSPGEKVMRYFAAARERWTQVREQVPHADHPDWLKLAGPSDTGNEVTYYAVTGNVLARVITVAAGDPAADATDIMGRVLRKVRGETPKAAVPKPAAPKPAEPKQSAPRPSSQATVNDATTAESEMAAVTFAQVDEFWDGMGYEWYVTPGMDLFEAPEMTGCGYMTSDPGPFYCLLDGTIYLDEPVVDMLAEYDADFLLGLFLAHEWGHHIQRLAGYDSAAIPIFDGQVWSLQAELAADCLAGVWAYGEQQAGRASAWELLAALEVMFAIGDEAGSPLTAPDAHGSGEMRAGAFSIGLDSGDPGECEDRFLQFE